MHYYDRESSRASGRMTPCKKNTRLEEKSEVSFFFFHMDSSGEAVQGAAAKTDQIPCYIFDLDSCLGHVRHKVL